MSKKSKKNLKKVHAKIDNTPVKAEAAKKEESKAAVKTQKFLQQKTMLRPIRRPKRKLTRKLNTLPLRLE